MKICPKCGNKILNHKKICRSCGEEVTFTKEMTTVNEERYTAIGITFLILALVLSFKLLFNMGFMLSEVRNMNIVNRIAFIAWKILPTSVFVLIGQLTKKHNKISNILSLVIVCILILISTVIIFK